MKSIITALAFFGLVGAASAQNFGTGSNPGSYYVSGYVRGDGSYVPPYYAGYPNGSTYDNYGTRGNNYDPYIRMIDPTEWYVRNVSS